MRNFLEETCTAKSSKYIVQCTPRGRTVYIYDSNGNELAKFQDMKHTYQCLISPDEKQFVLLSLCGMLAIYSTAEMKLLKKIRYASSDQDGGLCYSNDGKKLYLLEHINRGSMHSRLISYDTSSYTEKFIEFENPSIKFLSVAPFHSLNEVLLLGYKRNKDGLGFLDFMAVVRQNEIVEIRYFKETLDALSLASWNVITHKEMIRFFDSLYVPKSPFERNLSISEQWIVLEMIDNVLEKIAEYDQIIQTSKELKEGDNKFIFENEYKSSFKKIHENLNILNDWIYSINEKSPFDTDVNNISVDKIHTKCVSLLNCFYGI